MKKISDFNNATEKYPVVYAGSATRPEYVDMPTTLQQQEGVAPMDTLPAQWWNAMWKLATKDINAFRDYVGDAFTEINNLLTKFGITLDDADSEQLYNFFHDDYVQNYISTVLNTINGDLHIKGDLSVDGIGEEIISTELKVGANTITLRNENPTALGNTELAGVVTKNYDGNDNNNIIAIDKNGEARTGDIDIATRILYSNNGTTFFTDEDLTIPATIGANEEVRDTGNQTSGGVEIYEGITYSNDDTQPLLTRDETSQLPNGIGFIWDATNKRAIGGSPASTSAIVTSSTTINNIPIANNGSVKIMFTADITDTEDTGGVTPLTITYNGATIPIKANKNGTLVDLLAKEVETDTWKYLQAYTTLELVYQSDYDGEGNPAFIIMGNPVVLSSDDYTIYADGQVGNEFVGTVRSSSLTSIPYGWLECNGQAVSRTTYSALFEKFSTDTYDDDITHTLLSCYGEGDGSTTFNLPDYREVALVGAGTNEIDYDAGNLATHDIYTVGQFKDDRLQDHVHAISVWGGVQNNSGSNGIIPAYNEGSNNGYSRANSRASLISTGRYGNTTRGKRKGVTYIIKVI